MDHRITKEAKSRAARLAATMAASRALASELQDDGGQGTNPGSGKAVRALLAETVATGGFGINGPESAFNSQTGRGGPVSVEYTRLSPNTETR